VINRGKQSFTEGKGRAVLRGRGEDSGNLLAKLPGRKGGGNFGANHLREGKSSWIFVREGFLFLEKGDLILGGD